MLDLLSHHATLPGGRKDMSIAVRDGHILEVTPGHLIEALDAQGFLVSPPFVDAHFHMDATLSYGLPRVNQSGTLLDGIALWGELKPLLEVKRRVAPYLHLELVAFSQDGVLRGPQGPEQHLDNLKRALAMGVNVAFGHDCVMDPWYGLGSGDMLEVAHMGLHVAQMTSQGDPVTPR